MSEKSPLLRRAEDLVELIKALEEGKASSGGLKVHPETEDLLGRSRVPREQLNYAVPEVLEIKQRLAKYCIENAHATTPGNVMAGVIDAFLRSEGYPPLSHKTDSTQE